MRRFSVETLEQRLPFAADLDLTIQFEQESEVPIVETGVSVGLDLRVINPGDSPLARIRVEGTTNESNLEVPVFPKTASISNPYGFGELMATFDGIKINRFLEHPTRPLLFASVETNNSIAVFDTETLTLVDMIRVGIRPEGMAIAPDGHTLYIANSREDYLSVLDTRTLELRPAIPTQSPPYFVEVAEDNTLFVKTWESLLRIDPATGETLYEFTDMNLRGGFLAMNPSKDRLYFGNSASSISSYHQWDTSVEPPQLIASNGLGSYGQDLRLSPDGKIMSYVVVSDSIKGYAIPTIDTDTMIVRGYLETGAYPEEIEFSHDAEFAYTVNAANEIKVWNNSTFQQVGTIPTSGTASELRVGRSGQFIYAASETGLRVYSTGRGLATFNVGDADQDYMLSPGEVWEYATTFHSESQRNSVAFLAQGAAEGQSLAVQAEFAYVGLEYADVLENQFGAQVPDISITASGLLVNDPRFEFRDSSLALRSVDYLSQAEDDGLRLLLTDETDNSLLRAVDLSVLENQYPWQNPTNAFDVNGDFYLSGIDVLIVINDLNRNGARKLSQQVGFGEYFLDSSGDGFLSALDALVIINQINSSRGEAESSVQSQGAQAADMLFGFYDEILSSGPRDKKMWCLAF